MPENEASSVLEIAITNNNVLEAGNIYPVGILNSLITKVSLYYLVKEYELVEYHYSLNSEYIIEFSPNVRCKKIAKKNQVTKDK